jgi:deferrochelatase/peroxidase EfeB
MWQYGISGPQLELDDIQGDSVVGLQKDFQWFVFFTIGDTARFKEFARRTLLSRISSAAQVLKREHELQAHKESGHKGKLPLFGLNIGFTRAGLVKLGVPGLDEFNDSAFKDGMASRSTSVLNNPEHGPYSAREWTVGGQGKTLHGVILITGPSKAGVDEIKEELIIDLAAASGGPVTPVCGMTRPNNRGHEHFGFRDGISNPIIILDERLPASGYTWPGEVVFGYPSQDPESPIYPGKLASGGPEWTRNGSLMVVLRLVQRVPEFDRFIKAKADKLGMDRELFAARIVGRWKSGAPLSITPLLDDPLLGADKQRNNDFNFDNDQLGRRCPFASHIRKAYPRNDIRDFIELETQKLKLAAKKLETQKLELETQKLEIKNKEFETKSESEKREFFANDAYTHRVMRRSIPFGPELTSEEMARGKTAEGVERGLMFVCYQTSIERQFEYIVKNFINDDPANKRGPDALLGRGRDVKGLALSYPSGDPHQSISLDTFVSPTGGDYFFVPSLRAFEEFVAAPDARQIKGDKMATFNPKDIMSTFEQAKTLFNAGDFSGLLPLMHPNIFWKLLHHAGGYSGASNVVNFLNMYKKTLMPQFNPQGAPNVSTPNSDGSQRITGTAQWQAFTGSAPENIDYNFTLQQDTAGNWLLVNVFGQLL